jgi:hypothetical protein
VLRGVGTDASVAVYRIVQRQTPTPVADSGVQRGGSRSAPGLVASHTSRATSLPLTCSVPSSGGGRENSTGAPAPSTIASSAPTQSPASANAPSRRRIALSRVVVRSAIWVNRGGPAPLLVQPRRRTAHYPLCQGTTRRVVRNDPDDRSAGCGKPGCVE